MLTFSPIEETCNIGNSCNAVQNSIQAETFGVKNSLYGVGIFLFLTFLTFSQIKKYGKIKGFLINMGIIISFIISIYFIYLMVFVLNSYCKYCLVVDISMILGFLTIIFYHKKYKKWRYK